MGRPVAWKFRKELMLQFEFQLLRAAGWKLRQDFYVAVLRISSGNLGLKMFN